MSRIIVRDFPKICRLCLAKSKTLVNIYLNENGSSFEELIFENTTINVLEIDELPQQICKKCASFLGAASTFRKKAFNSDKFLRDVLENHRASLFTHQKEQIELTLYQADSNSAGSTSLGEEDPLNMDMKLEPLQVTNTFVDSECLDGNILPDPLAHVEDSQSCSFLIIVPETSEAILPEIHVDACKTSDTVNKLKTNLQKVVMSAERVAATVEQVDVADYCEGDGAVPEPVPENPLIIGVQIEGPSNLDVLCDVCGEQFASRSELRDHRRFIGHRRLVCATCGRHFDRKRKLIQHLAREHTVKRQKPVLQKHRVSAAPLLQEPPVSADLMLQEPPASADPLLQEPPVSAENLMQDRPVSADSLMQERPVSAECGLREQLLQEREQPASTEVQSASDKFHQQFVCLHQPAEIPRTSEEVAKPRPEAMGEKPVTQCNLCGRQNCRTADCTIQVEACVKCIRETRPDAADESETVGVPDCSLCSVCGQTRAGTKPCTLLVQACRRCIRKAGISTSSGQELEREGPASSEAEPALNKDLPVPNENLPVRKRGRPPSKKDLPAPNKNLPARKRGRPPKKNLLDSERKSHGSESVTSSVSMSSSANERTGSFDSEPVTPIPPSQTWQTWPLVDSSDTSLIRLRSGSVLAPRLLRQPKTPVCSVCAEVFPSPGDLRQHQQETLHNRTVCPECGPSVNFCNEYGLRGHQAADHSDIPCPECGLVLGSRLLLRAHQLETMHGLFPCTICNDRVDHGSRRGLRAHFYSDHRPPKIPRQFHCSQCSKVMVTRRYMEKHVLLHEHFAVDGNQYTCNICQLVVFGNMDKHLKAVHEIFLDPSLPTGLCTLCGAQVLLGELQTHTELHQHFSGMGATSTCNICLENVRREARIIHLRAHKVFLDSTDMVFCADCGEGFKNKICLIKHLGCHQALQSLLCQDCDIKFASVEELQAHRSSKHWMQRGLYERPHACNICQKKFRLKEYLTRHMRSHTGEKPFVCQMCQRAFSLRPNLVAHMRQHNAELPYRCAVCGQGFKHNVSLKNHMKYHPGFSQNAPPPPRKLAKPSATSDSEDSSDD